ncbi:ATP-binding protein [Streptomyces sp. SID3212]|uniref:ATP-binding protein n=1 Tax=unclassified Streptomyces TaxID=2593676 RepID=UPI0031F5F503
MFEPTGSTSWRIALPHSAAAVPMARALIRTALLDLRAPADSDVAELLTAELVANAVKHTEGDGIELVVELLPTGCQVEVHDRDPAPPSGTSLPWPPVEPGPWPDPWAENGRGLLLISTLSSDCGHRVTERGKAVWFTLPVDQVEVQVHEACGPQETRETPGTRECREVCEEPSCSGR